MPSRRVPVTGAVLDWALNEAGLSMQELAEKTKLSGPDIEAWIDGRSLPSASELKKVAEALKRPVSLFYLPRPPASAAMPNALRRAVGENERRLKPEELRQTRRARRVQKLIKWIMAEKGVAPAQLPRVTTNVAEAARSLRDWLGVSVQSQLEWDSAKEAFDEWRSAFESKGIVVLQLQLGKDGLRGFSLFDELTPLIAVNTGENYQARAFTLFHELGHIATGTESVCLDRLRKASSPNTDLERWCEEVASMVLLPPEALETAFKRISEGSDGELGRVKRVAALFKASLRATALALIRQRLVSREVYEELEENAAVSDREKGFGRGSGMSAIQRRRSELGNRALMFVFDALEADLLTERDARDYLRLDGTELSYLSSQVMTIP